MSKRTATSACPEWCTNHNNGETNLHPDDQGHWGSIDPSEFTALGGEPRLEIVQYLVESEPSLYIEWDPSLDGIPMSAEHLRALSSAVADLAVKFEEIAGGGDSR